MRVDAGAALLAALISGLIVGCGTGPAPTPVPPAALPATSPQPRPDLVATCANQLTYWAGEELRSAPDAGFDYQEMGLTGAQSDALDTLVEQARALGPDRPQDWLSSRARALCTDLAAQPSRTNTGWP
jgi:hypothetical protein